MMTKQKQEKGVAPVRIVFIGPPGSGKGTQGKILSGLLGIPHLSTGDMLRAEVATGSDLGKTINSYIAGGNYVPEDIIRPTVLKHLLSDECKKGFILDGFPRNLSQAEYLSDEHIDIDAVIKLQMSDQDVTKRLLKRASCVECGCVYQQNKKGTAVCPSCGSQKFKRRDDDNEDAIKHRLVIYRLETAPTVTYYEQKGVLICIKGDGCIRTVEKRIQEALKKRGLFSKQRTG